MPQLKLLLTLSLNDLYMLENKEPPYEPTDFIAIKVGSGQEDFTEDKIQWAIDNGYEFYNGYTDLIYVFVKSEYIENHSEIRQYQRSSPIVVEE